MKLKGKLTIALLFTIITACSSFAAFPEKDIRFIVPFAPGGGTDTLARILSAAAGKKFFNGHSLVVENMPGGGGAIGNSFVAKTAAPDGYTVLLYSGGTASVLRKVPYSYEDYKPLIGCNQDPEIVTVPLDSPYSTIGEVFEAAKTKTIKVSTPGHSTSHHIIALNLAKTLGLKFAYIHNDSAAVQLSQLMGGHADLSFMTLSEAAASIRSGKIRGIAVMSKEREKALPDIPTFAEQGYEGWIDGVDRGVGVSVNVPEYEYNYLIQEFRKVALTPEFAELMEKASMAFRVESPEEFQAYVDNQIRIYKDLKPLLEKK